MEATTNLIGGQPFSLDNLRAVKEIASAHNIPLVFDGSLISENAYLIKQREAAYADWSIGEIIREMMSTVDILYLSGRKSTAVRGGMIATNNKDLLQPPAGLAAGVRGLCHLRRHVHQGSRGDGRRHPRDDARPMWPAAAARVHQVLRRPAGCETACRS